MHPAPPCPLCRTPHATAYFQDKKRPYLRCPHCALVFVPEPHRVSPQKEKETYDLHDNNPQDKGYRAFLSRMSAPLMERLPPHQHGLDFGCGPGPTLSVMLKEHGHTMDIFDPFYHNEPQRLTHTYDFITATEVVEHLRDPDAEFTTLFGMLGPGGWLGIMTKMVTDQAAFSRWHYTHDPTHICFFSKETFEYIGQRFNAELSFSGNDVVLLQKR